MAEKIRLGLIGASVKGTWSSRSHLPAVRASTDIELTAVCTTRAESAEAFMKAMPLHRFAEPVEISRLVAYLASDESSYSTGSEFVADGGLLSGPGY